MAITVLGQSICPLCGKKMYESEEIYSFPPFVQNTKDPYYYFNDTAFHKNCLSENQLGNSAIKFSNEFISKTNPKNRICSVGKNPIRKVDDYIFIDLLTSDENEQLFKFNFTTLDVNNLGKWRDREDFLKLAINFQKSGKWKDLSKFKYLDNLIQRISESNS